MCFLSEPQGCPVASQTFRVGRLIKLCTKELQWELNRKLH